MLLANFGRLRRGKWRAILAGSKSLNNIFFSPGSPPTIKKISDRKADTPPLCRSKFLTFLLILPVKNIPYITILCCFLSGLSSVSYAQFFDNEAFGDYQGQPRKTKPKAAIPHKVNPDNLWVNRPNAAPTSPLNNRSEIIRKTNPQPPAVNKNFQYKYRKRNTAQHRYGQSHQSSPTRHVIPKPVSQSQNKAVTTEDLAPLSGTQDQNNGQTSRFDRSTPFSASNQRAAPSEAISFKGISVLTGDVWQDISMAQLQKVAPHLKLPLRSYTYQSLVAQLFLSKGSKPIGFEANPQRFQSIQLKILYRAGLMGVLRSYLKNIPLAERNPLTRLYSIKTRFALGRNQDNICEDLSDIVADDTMMSKENLAELVLHKAYCFARNGTIEQAQLSANIVREQGVKASIPFAVIDFLSGLGKPRFTLPNRLTLRDYLFLTLTGGRAPANLLEISEPALLHYLSHDKKIPQEQRVQAAEKTMKIDLPDSAQLSTIYQNISEQGQATSALRRANMYQAILVESDLSRKARKIQMLLRNAKRNNLAIPVAAILLTELKKIKPSKQMNWFAYAATEIAMLAHDYPLAMKWIMVSNRAKAGQAGSVANLFVLLEILDNHKNLPKKTGLLSAEDLAKTRYLRPHILHRLVTVLEALDYNIPIPLWEAASRTPQPQKGYLPPSGALSALQSAAKSKAPARTILMAIEATGPKGAQDVHLIGLRDIIQNLKKAGYETAARRLGFEALYAIWP